MKAIKKILLGITVVCTLMAVNIKPVSAADYIIFEWDSVVRLCSKLDDGEEIEFDFFGGLNIAHELRTAEINADNVKVVFKSYRDKTIELNSDNFYDFPMLEINGDNVTVEFDNVNVNYFRSGGDGGAIYVDGENCHIKNGNFYGCSAETDGGAICLNRDNAIVENCSFSYCKAGDDGGAIYVCAGADDCIIKNCRFSSCECEERGNAVCGDNDTRVINCTSDAKNSFKLCKVENSTGSIMSQGNIIIIASILVVAAVIVVILVVRKKKNNKTNSK